MLKQLLSDKRILCGFICVLVLVVAGVVYERSVKQQAQRDIRRTEKIVKERQHRETGSQSAENGHYHSDGTYHTGSHEAPADTTAPSGDGKRSSIAPERVIWTGKPLREVSAPDPLTPAERKARNAKIQALNTQIQKLRRITQAKTVECDERINETDKTLSEIDTISAELRALHITEDSTAEEQARHDALLKRYLELHNLARERNVIAKQTLEEKRALLENLDALEAKLSALRGR